MAKGIDMRDPEVATIMNNLPDVTDEDGTTRTLQFNDDLQLQEIADVLDDITPQKQRKGYQEKQELDEESLPTESAAEKAAKEKPEPTKQQVADKVKAQEEEEEEPDYAGDAEDDEDDEDDEEEEDIATEPADGKSELQQLQAQVETLRATIAELSTASTPAPTPEAVAEAEPAEPETSKTKTPAEPPELFTEDELDVMLSDPTALHKGLQRIYMRAREDGMTDAVKLATASIARQTQLQAQAESYFGKNEDIRPYRGFMTKYINEIYAANPKLTFPQLLEEAGNLTRRKLALANTAKAIDETTQELTPAPKLKKGQKPAFVRGSRNGSARQQPQQKLVGLKAEIEDLITD